MRFGAIDSKGEPHIYVVYNIVSWRHGVIKFCVYLPCSDLFWNVVYSISFNDSSFRSLNFVVSWAPVTHRVTSLNWTPGQSNERIWAERTKKVRWSLGRWPDAELDQTSRVWVQRNLGSSEGWTRGRKRPGTHLREIENCKERKTWERKEIERKQKKF